MKRILTLVIGLLSLLASPALALAAFDSNKVIENDAFTNSGALSAVKIQQFLDDRKSVLATYTENSRSAAGIIKDAAVNNGINPQVLLATLQKEQSLLTTSQSYNTATDPENRLKKAMGYACPDSSGCDPKYAGFTNQVDGAAFQLRYNYDGSITNKFKDYQVGQTMTFDGIATYLSNQATASLYRYTPHVSGNRSFYNSFFSYFVNYASHWAGQNSYPTLAPGDSYKFSLKLENSGNLAWDSSLIKLGTDRAQDHIPRFLLENRLNNEPTMWSTANRVGLNEKTVPVGGTGSFDFYMTVPTNLTTGTYREYFRPLAEGVQWLDDDQIYWDITVANHRAAWAGQNVGVKQVEPGESFPIEITLRNSGQTTWRNSGATPVRLGTSRARDRIPLFIREDQTTHSPSGWVTENRIQMVESTVAPGQTGTFRFWYTVPTSLKPGTYREYFQPIHENISWMDDLGIYVDVVVSPQKAAWNSQSGYVNLKKGESAQFTVQFRNTGTTTWQKHGATPIQLGTLRNQDRIPLFIRDDVPGAHPSGWVKNNRVEMVQESVAPGEIGTFTFWYTIPGDKTPGTYREFFGLVQDNYSWLPDQGVYWDITVS